MHRQIAPFLTVRMMMTPKSELCIFKSEDSVSCALSVMKENNYDVAPVETDGVLDRFVEKEKLMGKPGSLICDKVAQFITIKHIVSEHTSIENLLSLFCQQDFFFVIRQGEVAGIITYADLNKRVVKTLFYLLVSELEELLIKLIKHRFPKIEDCLKYVSPKRRKELQKTLIEAKKGNTEISMEHYLCLSDIMTIISKDVELIKSFGFTKSQARKILNPLVELRNRVMHQRPLITSKEEKVKLKEKYDILRDLTQRARNIVFED